MAFFGFNAIPDLAQADMWREILEAKVKKIIELEKEMGPGKGLASPKYNRQAPAGMHDPMHIDSLPQAMIVAYLMGSQVCGDRAQIEKSIDENVKSGMLLPIQADYYKFYLNPGDNYAGQFEDKLRMFKQKHEKKYEEYSKLGSKKIPAQARAYNKTYGFVQQHDNFKDYLELMTFTWPDPKIEDTLAEFSLGPNQRVCWHATRKKANEMVKVEFVSADGYTGRPTLEYDPVVAKINRANVHGLGGDFSRFVNDLLKYSTSEKDPRDGQEKTGTWIYIRIVGDDDKKLESHWHFLVLDGNGQAINFWKKA